MKKYQWIKETPSGNVVVYETDSIAEMKKFRDVIHRNKRTTDYPIVLYVKQADQTYKRTTLETLMILPDTEYDSFQMPD